jgi:AcrR family transcriptional regulator
MASPSPLKVPLQPSDWIRAGMARLASDGIESVRVEVMARDLRVSKGSFYWHFHDREELLAKILNHWEAEKHTHLTSCAERTAAQRWAWFIEQNSIDERVRTELAMRGWARKDPKVSASVRKADHETSGFVSEVLREIGFAKASAEAWAEIVLLVWLGWLDRAANGAGSNSGGSTLGDALSRVVLAASSQLSAGSA